MRYNLVLLALLGVAHSFRLGQH
jgi:hypothetical protein